uniref:Uncharacterized protein n=1 Tax=Anguilla anguilla TaxID=7936 RepID=A0A0E9WXB0_ANGAN
MGKGQGKTGMLTASQMHIIICLDLRYNVHSRVVGQGQGKGTQSNSSITIANHPRYCFINIIFHKVCARGSCIGLHVCSFDPLSGHLRFAIRSMLP